MRSLGILLFMPILLLFATSYCYSATINGLVLYFQFNEGKGDVAEDLSGNNNNGSLKGAPEWVDGKDGTALRFDGAANKDYVEVEDNPSLNPADEITCAAWIYFDEFVASGGIISKYIGAGNQRSYNLRLHHDSGLALSSDCSADGAFAAGASALTTSTDANTLVEAKWQHVAMTFTAKDVVRLYINGEMKAEGNVNFMANLFDNTVPLLVGNDFQIGGSHRAGQPREFTGIIDEVAIFNRALSDDEIQKVMNGEIMAVESNGKLAVSWGSIKGQ